MGHGVDIGNVIVGFGGVFVLAIIGAVVHWYLGVLDDRDARRDDRTRADGAAPRPSA